MQFLKNSCNRIFRGFQLAYSTPTLPDNLIKFTNHPIIRIIRVLGSISFLMIMSKSFLQFTIFI